MNTERVSVTVPVNGPVRKENAWKIIVDFSNFPKLSNVIDALVVSDKSINSQVSEWDVTFDGAPLTWIQKDTFVQDNFSIDFKALSGDFDHFAGSIYVKDSSNQESGISLSYTVNYIIGIPIIEQLFGPVFKEKMQSNFNSILNDIGTQISRYAVSNDERLYRRYKIGVLETIMFDGVSFDAKIEDFSIKGIKFFCDKNLERPVSAKICGKEMSISGFYHDLKQKTYRLEFQDMIDENDFLDIVKTLQGKHVTTLGKYLIREAKEAVYS